MRILGLDPGRTTGAVVIDTSGGKPRIVYQAEIPLDQLSPHMVADIMGRTGVKEVVVEGVVASGYLSRDKVDQIRAYDRCLLGARVAKNVHTLTPEMRKHTPNIPKPKVSSDHIRDAYKHAVTIAYKGGGLRLDEPAEDISDTEQSRGSTEDRGQSGVQGQGPGEELWQGDSEVAGEGESVEPTS